MSEPNCEHYWAANGSYFCIHCGMDINKKKERQNFSIITKKNSRKYLIYDETQLE